MGIVLARENPTITPIAPMSAPPASPFVMAGPQGPQTVTPIPNQRPNALLQPSQATEPDEMPAWLKAVGKTAKGMASFAFGNQDAPVGQAPDRQRAAVVLRAAHTRPADTFERLSGSKVDDTFEEMRQTYAEEIPDDLSRDEKGMLLMQLGFGIMSGGPGLVPALGQAGMQMMGSWQQMRAQRQRAGEATKRDKLGILETQARIEAGREADQAENAARVEVARLKAAEPVKMGAGDVLLDPQTQQPLYTAPRAPQQPPEAPAMIREMQAMGFDPTNPEHQQKFFGLRRASEGGGEGTALMQNAQYLARVKGIPEDQAADIMLMSAAGRENPDQVRRDIYMTALRETGDASEAMRITDQSMQLLSGAPAPEGEAEAPEAPGLMSKALSAITQTARAMLPKQETAPEATGTIPPPIGTVEDGYRYKGGDPSKPESWEAVQ